MFAQQRLQKLQSWLDADEESLPSELREHVRDGERLTVPLQFMDSLSRDVFETGLADRTLTLADAKAAAVEARHEAGLRVRDAWRHPPGQYGVPPAPLAPHARPVIAGDASPETAREAAIAWTRDAWRRPHAGLCRT